MHLAITWDDAKANLWRSSAAAPNEYWSAAHKPLATALALAHQGVELLLKANICAVSPFLLIAGDPRAWPQGAHIRDTPFSDFRTIDSQDLVRAHDSVRTPRLTDQFKTCFDQIRQDRNRILHSVDPRLSIQVGEIVSFILEAHHTLVGERRWVSQRRRYLSATPESISFAESSHGEDNLVREMMLLLELLDSRQVTKYFGFNKKQRRYICPNCKDIYPYGKTPFLAILEPNMPNATSVHCVACDNRFTIQRKPCKTQDCKGNVILLEDCETFVYEACLTCGTCQNQTRQRGQDPII